MRNGADGETVTTRSGQWTYQRDLTVMCMACDWTGIVEATIDDSRHDCLWKCPGCATETIEEWRAA
jgi:hypothetical protein